MSRANPKRILPYSATRSVLRRIAEIACGMEGSDKTEFLSALAGEIASLRSGDRSANVWRQAIAEMSGPELYGLERIGLLPPDEK